MCRIWKRFTSLLFNMSTSICREMLPHPRWNATSAVETCALDVRPTRHSSHYELIQSGNNLTAFSVIHSTLLIVHSYPAINRPSKAFLPTIFYSHHHFISTFCIFYYWTSSMDHSITLILERVPRQVTKTNRFYLQNTLLCGLFKRTAVLELSKHIVRTLGLGSQESKKLILYIPTGHSRCLFARDNTSSSFALS